MKSETLTKFVKTLDSRELEELLNLCQKETADRFLSNVNFLQFLFEPPDDRSAGTLRFSIKSKNGGTLHVKATVLNGDCEDVSCTVESEYYRQSVELWDFEIPEFYANTTQLEARQLCAKAFIEFDNKAV